MVTHHHTWSWPPISPHKRKLRPSMLFSYFSQDHLTNLGIRRPLTNTPFPSVVYLLQSFSQGSKEMRERMKLKWRRINPRIFSVRKFAQIISNNIFFKKIMIIKCPKNFHFLFLFLRGCAWNLF